MPAYPNILAALSDQVWAITPDKMEQIAGFVQTLGADDVRAAQRDFEAMESRMIEVTADMDPTDRLYARQGVTVNADGIATLPVRGTMMKRMNLMSSFSGGASTEMIGGTLRALDADDRVRGVVLDVDSPGGSALGLSEVAATLRGMEKPTAAVANDMMASAAYFLASAADKVYATGDAAVGSIGTIMKRMDFSEKLAADGIKEHIWRSGPYKALGSPSEPLTEREDDETQRIVDSFYANFVETVATNRNLSLEQVAAVADGRVFIGAEAVANNLVDEIKTVADAIAEMSADLDAKEQTEYAFQTARTWEASAQESAAKVTALEAEVATLKAAITAQGVKAAGAAADEFISSLVSDGKVAAAISDPENPNRAALHARLVADFDGVKSLYDLVPAGAAAPKPMPNAAQGKDLSASIVEQVAAARKAGTPVADDKYAAEAFTEAGVEFVKGYVD